MRGKNIIWLSLMAMLLMPMMVNMGFAARSNTQLYITPKVLPAPGVLGHPGDVFEMAVNIDNIENLWSVGFKVLYAPYGRPLVVSEIKEGTFLKQGGYLTSFVYKVNALKGELSIGITRLTYGTPVGASGSGTLATFKFTVVTAGDSDINLDHVALLDPALNPMAYKATGGRYTGVTANLVSMVFEEGKTVYVGGSLHVDSLARNDGDSLVKVRTRFDLERLEDGRRIKIYSGQNYAGGGLGEPNPYEYFYVNEYLYNIPGMPLYGGMPMDTVEDGGWTNSGASLIGEPDGNYAETTTPYAWTGWYGFEDINLAGRVILNIDLEGYTQQPDDTVWDFDPYVAIWKPDGTFYRYRWCDSMGGSNTWAWTGGRYYKGTANDMPEYYDPKRYLYTEYSFNRMTLFIENYCDDNSREQIDALRWIVYFSPITPVNPVSQDLNAYTQLAMAPFTINAITEDMIGTYVVTATLEYSLTGANWMEGAKSRTATLNILP